MLDIMGIFKKEKFLIAVQGIINISIIKTYGFLQPFLGELKDFVEENILPNDYKILSDNNLSDEAETETNKKISRFLKLLWIKIFAQIIIPLTVEYISPGVHDFVHEIIQTYFSAPPPPDPPVNPVFLESDDLSHGDDKIKERLSEPRFTPGLKNDEPQIQEQINFDPVQVTQANQNLNPVEVNPIPDLARETYIDQILSVISAGTIGSLMGIVIIVAHTSIKSICMC
jgi:hypothetical protein